jgi:hypothetical protein
VDVLKTLKTGGPWYVYGLSTDELVSILKNTAELDGLLNVSK